MHVVENQFERNIQSGCYWCEMFAEIFYYKSNWCRFGTSIFAFIFSFISSIKPFGTTHELTLCQPLMLSYQLFATVLIFQVTVSKTTCAIRHKTLNILLSFSQYKLHLPLGEWKNVLFYFEPSNALQFNIHV